MADAERDEEFTVDVLAERAGMTVRNVRAYSTRGLIDPPRLEGRTGYYSQKHLQRLVLIRTLLGRGFTLAAIEDAILKSPSTASNVALDLISIFEVEDDEDPTELIGRAELASISGLGPDHELLDKMTELGLLEKVDEDTIRMLEPGVVRPGAAAVAIGLSPDSVVDIVPHMREHLEQVSDRFVHHVTRDVVQPFLDAGLPQDEWPVVFEKIDQLIPIASQVVVSMFRSVLRQAIETEIGHKLEELAAEGDQPTS
ncbi:MerR family transcriptional regulator [Aeromicrobium sp. 636]|uniref:MerR family transcriptional regulator n=1 Tax=Aeromicrobium senzhongii TaxID=2663859 RepID=A0A8I0EVM2_9ACTN|nr:MULTISPECIES: MerR family transcriptional regulator [Aeromicrobium]MBC9226369.1 MerR family transcriptional regulator [Aeromicrobium senzhongii]MCQ3998474.1 MerR family transcriptional regulator [Aeromicrobium sp. 636]MTB88896.1 MerR family transcriptional regulator [Aeromicrobium senzhongii]QNL93821.1 MerR family transcriptional regulator [Aeromicrobium senzhongii]